LGTAEEVAVSATAIWIALALLSVGLLLFAQAFGS
jgi:hypothetical protein